MSEDKELKLEHKHSTEIVEWIDSLNEEISPSLQLALKKFDTYLLISKMSLTDRIWLAHRGWYEPLDLFTNGLMKISDYTIDSEIVEHKNFILRRAEIVNQRRLKKELDLAQVNAEKRAKQLKKVELRISKFIIAD